jgi:hypothetical protein
MKKLLSVKNIAITVLVALVMVKWFGPKETVYIDKPYEVAKSSKDTVTVVETEVVFKKGKTVYEKVTVEKEVVVAAVVDTMNILKQYYSRVGYQDTLRLDSLGTVSVLDSITQNRIFTRRFVASIKPRLEIKKDTVSIKEPAKTKLYYGPEGGFNHTNLVSHVGIAVLVKSKKDVMYNIGIGYSNQRVDKTNFTWTPYLSTGIFWRVK